MTEPPRPPGEDPGAPPPDPTFDRPAPPNPTSGPPSTPPAGGPAGGYPPPGQGGGYPPPGQGGYPPPGYGYPSGGQYGGQPPAGYANQDDKTWALIAHFGGAAGAFLAGWLGFLAPLVALLARGKESPTVRAHAVAALNFQLTWIGISVAMSLVLCCVTVVTLGFGAFGFGLLAVPWLVATIFGIVAGVKAIDGELYRYPTSINLVK
ncbi:MAG TPA: DUF4870 domain-containing protein [Micromonosporaceae bacterium]